MRYSGFKVFLEGLTGNRGWKPAWRDPEPKSDYDVIIIGGGGHGLSTAYYLSKVYGVRNVAVLEKGWLGSGNIGRNTTIIRSNYMLPGNEPFYEFSLKLWEGLEQDFNYNAMISQRSILNLFHSDPQRDAFVRRANAMMLQGQMLNWQMKHNYAENFRFWTLTMRAFPSRAGFISGAAVPYAMMRSLGGMPRRGRRGCRYNSKL